MWGLCLIQTGVKAFVQILPFSFTLSSLAMTFYGYNNEQWCSKNFQTNRKCFQSVRTHNVVGSLLMSNPTPARLWTVSQLETNKLFLCGHLRQLIWAFIWPPSHSGPPCNAPCITGSEGVGVITPLMTYDLWQRQLDITRTRDEKPLQSIDWQDTKGRTDGQTEAL